METLTDIVFAARNRAYGAFALRQSYARTLRRATVLGSVLVSAGLIAPVLLAHYTPRDRVTVFKPETVVLPPPPEEAVKPVVPPPPPAEAPKVKTTRFLPPEITAEEVPEELPPTQEQLTKAPASDLTREGTFDPNEMVDIPAEPAGRKPEVVELNRTDEVPFTRVEQQPEFPGGIAALSEFLRKNLRYPKEASNAGIAGKVYLDFVVRADGSIDRIQIQKGVGFGCDEEARRVVGLMPKWRPGKQSGRAVPARFTLPIGFVLE
ncbi:MAG: TonB family protein [Sphingobacteriaceae bacterium]|nr:TonB family protein [Cytophagaceae bacterium]